MPRLKKNPVTKLVAAGVKAATGKMASKAIKAPKGSSKNITTGKMKAAIKANKYKSEGTGAVHLSTTSGNIREYMSGAKVKGTARKVRDNAQRAELEAKGYSKRASALKYPSNKLLKGFEKQANPKPKVPVKKKSK